MGVCVEGGDQEVPSSRCVVVSRPGGGKQQRRSGTLTAGRLAGKAGRRLRPDCCVDRTSCKLIISVRSQLHSWTSYFPIAFAGDFRDVLCFFFIDLGCGF